jgi:hypothetical protein
MFLYRPFCHHFFHKKLKVAIEKMTIPLTFFEKNKTAPLLSLSSKSVKFFQELKSKKVSAYTERELHQLIDLIH